MLFLPTLGSLIIISSFYYYVNKTKQDVLFVNVAGRQRMLSEQIHAYVHMVHEMGQAVDREPLRELVIVFDNSLAVLNRGGEILGSRLMRSPPEIKDEIEVMSQLWEQLKPSLLVIADQPQTSLRAVEAYNFIQMNISQLKEMSNAVVLSFESLSLDQKKQIFTVLIIVSSVNFVLLLVGILITKGYLAERKKAEEAIRESEVKFRNVVKQTSDGLYVLQENRFVFINPRFTEITGYYLEELSTPDFNYKQLVAEEGIKVLEERESLRQQGEEPPNQYIFKGLRKDGREIDLDVSVTSIEWEGAPAVLGTARNVTKRIEARKKLEEALQSAKQANNVKTLFLANMSHEIRTPLNAILGFTDIIKKSTSHLIGEEEKGFFDIIRDGGNRLMETVHEILDISQIEAGTYKLQMEQLDLVTLVKELVNEVIIMADKKGLKMEYISEIDSAFIKADQYGVTQAISNIIDNAIKYTEQGEINVLLKQTSEKYVLLFQDTGIGIAEEYLDNLFEAFSQESEGFTKKYQGIGLGMAIAKRHLDMNQVDINVESTKDVGTTFTLTFKPTQKPLPEKLVEKGEVEVKPSVWPVKKPLVLLVEDDPSSQKLTKFFLKAKFDIYFAVSVKEAKEQLKKYPIDLILLDLSLVGNEDGLDLVRWMRKTKTWQKTPVVAVTAHAFTTDRDNCLAAGCNDYLTKPIKREELIEKLGEYL